MRTVLAHSFERIDIPGFRRGRRCVAADSTTFPEFFALYEADSMQVLQGSDYANRRNNPTPRMAVSEIGARGPFMRGIYRLEYVRTKTGFAP